MPDENDSPLRIQELEAQLAIAREITNAYAGKAANAAVQRVADVRLIEKLRKQVADLTPAPGSVQGVRIRHEYRVMPMPLEITEDWLSQMAEEGWCYGGIVPGDRVMFFRICAASWEAKA